jgi:hypothetical protein
MTGQMCEARTGAAASGTSNGCRSVCYPDEHRNAQGCCVPATSETSSRADCAAGLSRSPDTAGRCCWEGQAWAHGCCVGRPTSCPAGFVTTASGCGKPICADGLVRMSDGLHCCWPEQAWSSLRNECVGESATKHRAEEVRLWAIREREAAAEAERQRQERDAAAETQARVNAEAAREQESQRRLQAQLRRRKELSDAAEKTASAWHAVGGTLFVTGLLTGSSAIYFVTKANDTKKKITMGELATSSGINSAVDSVNTNRKLAIAAGVVGVASIITGISLMSMDPSVPADSPSLTINVAPGMLGVAIAGQWR